ncbi:MAG: sigma-70 family RNA polymerase sigma factor [Pseudomonadota bacterium]
MSENIDTMEMLLARVAEGDRLAFRHLYDRSVNVVFAVLLKILVRRDIAEDALQDVYVRVWKRAASYRTSRGNALTWLTSVARHRALDIRRSSWRETALPDDFTTTISELSADDDPMLAAEWGDQSRRLKACLDGLSSDQSGSIQLAYLRGYSHSEVAASVGAPIGTVKSWIRRGLSALKRCLSE